MIRWIAIFILLLSSAVVSSTTQTPDDSTSGERDSKLAKPPELVKDTLPVRLDFESAQLGFSNLPDVPEENPLTEERIELGRKLFFDPVLSADKSVACSSCHRPDTAFANSEKTSVGIEGRIGKRNVPTILNRGYGKHFFWDGRAASMEEQVLSPLINPAELGNQDVESVVQRLKNDSAYVAAFSEAFGVESNTAAEMVTAENLARAIASFQRVMIYGETKVDRFRASEYTALSREARQGMWIFESRGGCWKCHSGENFSDEEFHNTGVSFGELERDLGRFEKTELESDRFKFKTPTLRGVELTAPYMHDGSLATLKDVVEFYNKGGAPDDSAIDSDIKPLDLSDEEVEYLVEFLKALSK